MTKSDIYINEVLIYIMNHYGVDEAYRDIYPLEWYINTGRASAEFLRKLYTKKPFLIARRLHKGGSVDETVKRIKSFLGC